MLFRSAAAADERIVAVRGGGEGDVTDTHVLWLHKTKHTDHIVSPFLSDGRLLLLKGGGIRTVFDAKTGLPLRSPQRVGRPTNYFASPVSGDGKIYLAGENGLVTVLKDGPDYETLAVNNVEQDVVATPAVADGALLLRTREKLL